MCSLLLQKKIKLKVLRFFLYAESQVTIFIVLLIIKFDCFGIDITFNFTDCAKSFDFQNREEPIKSLRSCTHLDSSRIALLTKMILTKMFSRTLLHKNICKSFDFKAAATNMKYFARSRSLWSSVCKKILI